MVEILSKDEQNKNTEDVNAEEDERVNHLAFAPTPGEAKANMDDLIAQQKFIDNSVSMGSGEDNHSVLPDEFRERHDLEQYFFTKEIIDKYIQSFMMKYQGDKDEIEKKVCFLCAPSLATAFYERHNINITCLDIDTRFKNLPSFRYWDI